MTTRRYLLDTNMLSDVVRQPGGNAARRCIELGETLICTSIIAACELRFGARKRGNAALTRRIEQLLNSIDILSLGAPADHAYAEARMYLEKAGTPISHADLLLAAHAISVGCTLVTDNIREFQRVPKLRIENWLR